MQPRERFESRIRPAGGRVTLYVTPRMLGRPAGCNNSFFCSRQNAELAKLRQECNKLGKELSEKSEVLQQEEQQRKSWEMKAVASEKQLEQLQVRQALAGPRWLVARGQLAEAKQEHGALPDVSPLILSGLLHLRVVLVILSEKRTQEGGRREGELTGRAKPRGVLGLGS